MGARILIADDDVEFVTTIDQLLTSEGFEARVLTDPRLVQENLEEWHPDLIILGVLMPHLDGLSLMSMLRRTSSIPVFLVSENATSAERTIGLRFGADDYLSRPVDGDELLERIRAILRRSTREVPDHKEAPFARQAIETVVVGNLRIDSADPFVTVGGRSIVLTPTELRLLARLAAHAQRTVSRAQLWEAIAGADSPVRDRVLDSHVWRLRDKLRAVPNAPTIETVRGFGYRFRPSGNGGSGVGG